MVRVALEKAQVAVLAERLGELLARSSGAAWTCRRHPRRRPRGSTSRSSSVPRRYDDADWDGRARRWSSRRAGIDEDEDEDDDEDEVEDGADDGPDMLRVQLSAPAARGFIARAERGRRGRPTAVSLCGAALNPEGHICPRKNGYMN